MNDDATVYAVITLGDDGTITDVEFLDEPPSWDLEALNQVCRVGNVNGGDSAWWEQDRCPGCDRVLPAHADGCSYQTL